MACVRITGCMGWLRLAVSVASLKVGQQADIQTLQRGTVCRRGARQPTEVPADSRIDDRLQTAVAGELAGHFELPSRGTGRSVAGRRGFLYASWPAASAR